MKFKCLAPIGVGNRGQKRRLTQKDEVIELTDQAVIDSLLKSKMIEPFEKAVPKTVKTEPKKDD